MPSMKKIVKYLLAVIMYYSGLLSLYWLIKAKSAGRKVPLILMYHRVLPDIHSAATHTQPGMSVSSEVFDRQMRFLRQRFTVSTVTALVEHLEKNGDFPGASAAVTFDDGWRDNYEHAAPILRKHSLPATIFVTTDYVGTNQPFWFLMAQWLLIEGSLGPDSLVRIVTDAFREREADTSPPSALLSLLGRPAENADDIIEQLKLLPLEILDTIVDAMLRESGRSLDYWRENRPMLLWDEVRKLSEQGVEIGSHGCSHRILTLLPTDQVMNELVDSKTKIEQILNESISSFSYPNGNYSEEIKGDVARAGFKCAVTTKGPDKRPAEPDRYALRRVAVHQGVSVGPNGGYSQPMFMLHLARNL